MNIEIMTAHLEQYRSVRNNAVDALKEFVSSDKYTLEEKWTLYCNYYELTITTKELVESVKSVPITHGTKVDVLIHFVRSI